MSINSSFVAKSHLCLGYVAFFTAELSQEVPGKPNQSPPISACFLKHGESILVLGRCWPQIPVSFPEFLCLLEPSLMRSWNLKNWNLLSWSLYSAILSPLFSGFWAPVRSFMLMGNRPSCTSPIWSIVIEEVTSSTLKKSWLLASYYFALAADIRKYKSLMWTNINNSWTSSSCSKKAFYISSPWLMACNIFPPSPCNTSSHLFQSWHTN